ncbi:MAG TPA: fumarylacetoacetate hydrolase family protein [Steroidobacteraceae bacterium]|jgi:fumarylacetoacetate (FAA) hydrolase
MKLASKMGTSSDGRLLIVGRDLASCVEAEAAPTLQYALDHWRVVRPELDKQYAALNAGRASGATPVNLASLSAAMPRSFQFLDASAFLAHNHILAEAWGFEPRSTLAPPLMYQGLSDRFYPPHGSVPFRSTDDEIDFEVEFAVLTDRVPLGVSADEAMGHVKLVALLNDWSLRAFGPSEMKGGFGFIHAKPPSSMSAFAVTPDELGGAWHKGRVCLAVNVYRNGALFGRPSGAEMSFGFHDLIAHAATTRELCAGTVIGSGTVSNANYKVVGSGCIAEKRAIDKLSSEGEPTPYLKFGEQLKIEAFDPAGQLIFGSMDQVVSAL